MKKYNENIRHGDLVLVGVDKLPAGLKASKSNVLMTGSGGNDHVVKGGTVYPVEGKPFVIGYLVTNGRAKLLHPEHGTAVKGNGLRSVTIPAGIYELRRQVEDTHQGMRPVVD